MWSSNLVKHFYANVPQDEEKRIIDSNELVRQRLEKLAEITHASSGEEALCPG